MVVLCGTRRRFPCRQQVLSWGAALQQAHGSEKAAVLAKDPTITKLGKNKNILLLNKNIVTVRCLKILNVGLLAHVPCPHDAAQAPVVGPGRTRPAVVATCTHTRLFIPAHASCGGRACAHFQGPGLTPERTTTGQGAAWTCR